MTDNERLQRLERKAAHQDRMEAAQTVVGLAAAIWLIWLARPR